MQHGSNICTQKFGLWSSWIFAILTVVGWLGIAHFYVPAPADLGLEATKVWFTETYRTGILVGCSIFYIACCFLVISSVQFGFMLAKIEGKRPLWSIVTVVSGVFISLIIFTNSCAWMVAAYRPEFGADVIQSWSDWAWFAFLLGWAYLALEMIATALVDLADKRDKPMVPRWFSWATIAGAFGLIGAGGIVFFKSGPFAYHGLMAFYVPMGIWGIYLVVTAWFMYKELDREALEARTTSGEEH